MCFRAIRVSILFDSGQVDYLESSFISSVTWTLFRENAIFDNSKQQQNAPKCSQTKMFIFAGVKTGRTYTRQANCKELAIYLNPKFRLYEWVMWRPLWGERLAWHVITADISVIFFLDNFRPHKKEKKSQLWGKEVVKTGVKRTRQEEEEFMVNY